MTKQIKIEELIPFMKKGWVACDKDGIWCWYSKKPKKCTVFWRKCFCHYSMLNECFNIVPAKDWKNSLIKVDIIQNYNYNYSACNCEICQIGRKFPEVQYAYYYAKYYFAKYVLDVLKKQKVKFSFEKLADKTGDYLNELGCVCQDTLACGEYMEEMERDYPKLKNFIKK